MSANETADRLERDRRRIEAFVLRARRVESHSLARDRDHLGKLAKLEFQVELQQDGTGKMRVSLPPEEQVESAAARVRPIILNGDDCFYASVLRSISALVEDARVRDWAKAVRNAWETRLREGNQTRGMVMMVRNTRTGQEQIADDVTAAMSWFYGDVVHHDRGRRAQADILGLKARYQAAVPLVAFAMQVTITMLHSVRDMVDQGLLSIDTAVWDELVALDSTEFEHTFTGMYTADLGMPMPAGPAEPLGSEWKAFRLSGTERGTPRREEGA